MAISSIQASIIIFTSLESMLFRKMAPFSPQVIFGTAILVLLLILNPTKAMLDAHYYDQTCPQAENIILQTVRNASSNDRKAPARILRMFFHDCFVRGCDASILLDSTPENKAEKDGPPNLSLGAFYVIDDAKAKLEASCPRTVSCADIIAIAARDAVAISGSPYWNVLNGRKDGSISKANETINLPAPSFNSTQLIQSFTKRGLKIKDLVSLSGGHTLGFSHCSSFESRLRNFSLIHDIDPSMNAEFAETLRKKCPKENKSKDAGEFLDSTSPSFDNDYYRRVLERKGVFGSDQTLYGDYRTRWIVESFARDEALFFREFAASMVRLGSVGASEDGEVRQNCRVVN